MYLDGHIVDVVSVLFELGLMAEVDSDVNMVMRCPWPENHRNGDRHPSFSINTDTGAWICYSSCGAGYLVGLVSRLKRIDKEEAIRFVLRVAGGDISFDRLLKSLPSFGNGEDEDKSKSIAIMKADYNFMDSSTTSSYFLERGFTIKTISSWGIRYDRQLRAIVIPIYSINGDFVGVVRRFVPPLYIGQSKYKYSKEFDRKENLFAANRYVPGSDTIVVEGPLDALWLHQNGFTSAVALMGSYISNSQIDLLKKLSYNIVVALDNDPAGRDATVRLIERVKGVLGVRLVELPEESDVQDLTKEELSGILNKSVYSWVQ